MVFTGIVQRVGLAKFDPQSNILRVTIDDDKDEGPSFWAKSVQGDSISVNGVCLTLLKATSTSTGEFFVMEETRMKTNLAALVTSEDSCLVNVEHALRVGDSLGGHTVSGHVDGTATIAKINSRSDGSRDVWIDLSKFDKEAVHIVHKGSICIDGVSLTIAEIKDNLLRVSLIVYTLHHTNLQHRKEGDVLNIEFDQTLKLLRTNHSLHLNNQQSNAQWNQRLTDEEWMLQAVALGEKGKITAPPNPWVASIIVNAAGQVIGRGYHQKAGQPHAEVNAVKDAIENGHEEELAGSTVYVTLEPCHHFGRTPPCDQLLIQKKVKRVVVALQDPDTRVSGQGIQTLRDNGISVEVGIGEEAARESLRSYLHHRASGRPYVVAKVALSMDGKIGCVDGSSQWITGEEARQDAHKLRAESQAIVVGTETALIDKPRLNVRGLSGDLMVQPLRIVLDSKGKVVDGPLMDTTIGPTLVFTSSNVPDSAIEKWKTAGVQHQAIGTDENGLLKIEEVLAELGKRGILQVMVEGGAKLHSYMLKKGLIDRLVIYQGSCLIGSSGRSWMTDVIADTMKDRLLFEVASVKQFGNDVRTEYVRKQ